VDFDEMLKRLNAYKKEEELSYSKFLGKNQEEKNGCRL